VSAPLQEFLSVESDLELERIEVAIAVREAERALDAVEFPGPVEAPAPPPLVEFPAPAPIRTPLPRQLVRLKIDYVNITPTIGEPCPCCGRPLKYSTVTWPGGLRPAGDPESAWFCSWCRQFYVYSYSTPVGAEKAS